ncbi:SH3 domain-containing protein [uncultured Jannaschia sp.]|uniref:SH3 domain-containing protein n=1 Tax=uncultured Jannaschia sp. TaxID=293347 RepID=UPI002633D9E4|nr:SH3 domain-containing protein [uncultured Jannaschia sp.]
MRLAPFLICLALLPGPAVAQTLYVRDSEAGYLNLRNGPGTRHDVLRRLSPGDRVDVQETLGRWTRVRLPDGSEGWVSGDYLERGAPASAALFVKPTTIGYLNLRQGPGTDTPVLRRIYPGDRLAPLAQDGVWIEVRHATGARGWVHSDFVTR